MRSCPGSPQASFRAFIRLALAAVTIEIAPAGQITSRNPFHLMTPTISRLALAALALSASILTAQPALAAVACGSGNFDAWLADFKADAAAKGVSQQAVAAGLAGVTLDQSVLNRDRSQKVFTQTFEESSARMVPP